MGILITSCPGCADEHHVCDVLQSKKKEKKSEIYNNGFESVGTNHHYLV